MRISDWSSDVCSSDLQLRRRRRQPIDQRLGALTQPRRAHLRHHLLAVLLDWRGDETEADRDEIGLGPRRGERGDPAALAAAEETGAAMAARRHPARRVERRSEEHTSELQSLMRISYAVFCL